MARSIWILQFWEYKINAYKFPKFVKFFDLFLNLFSMISCSFTSSNMLFFNLSLKLSDCSNFFVFKFLLFFLVDLTCHSLGRTNFVFSSFFWGFLIFFVSIFFWVLLSIFLLFSWTIFFVVLAFAIDGTGVFLVLVLTLFFLFKTFSASFLFFIVIYYFLLY